MVIIEQLGTMGNVDSTYQVFPYRSVQIHIYHVEGTICVCKVIQGQVR